MKSVNIQRLLTASLLTIGCASLSIADEITLKPKVLGSIRAHGPSPYPTKTVVAGCFVGIQTKPKLFDFTKPQTDGYRTIAEFDLSELPKGAQIESAVLRIKQVSIRPSISVSARGYVGDGKLTTSDFDGSLLAGITSKLNETSQIPVTKFVQDLTSTSKRYAGFSLQGPALAPSDRLGFDSLSTDPQSSPSLIVTYKVKK